MSNQYFAITDGSGHYAIENVPAGNHSIQAWHEAFPEPITKTITIEAGKLRTERFHNFAELIHRYKYSFGEETAPNLSVRTIINE